MNDAIRGIKMPLRRTLHQDVMSVADVNRYCKGVPPPGMKIWGCSLINRTDHKCYIVRIDDWEVARHERAHCAGWPKDHPGGF